MQKWGQFDHGELTELSVTGGQEVLVAALAVPSLETLPSKSEISAHFAIVGAGAGSSTIPSPAAVAPAVRPGPVGAPVSSTNGDPAPPPTRVKVNFGQTFSVESKVLEFIVIEPVEDL